MAGSSSILAVALVSLIAVISPGPDFCIVLKNSLSYSRKAGQWTALGIAIALIIHLTYTLLGIGVVIAENPFLYALIKYAGVGYLFYIGLCSIIASYKKSAAIKVNFAKSENQITPFQAFRQGFLTNLLNPKAAIFFISLFSQFIDTETPMLVRLEYAAVNWSIVLGWFLFFSYLITAKKLLGKIDQFRLYIDRVMGAVLMLLGMKLLFI